MAVRVTFRADSVLRQVSEIQTKVSPGVINLRLRQAHTELATGVQNAQVDHLVQRVEATGRPQRPGAENPRQGALGLSILDERNRRVGEDGFDVGILAWLNGDAPASKYWRQIEEGNPKVYQWRGWFYEPGGPHPADPMFFREHGRFRQNLKPSRKAGLISVGPFPAYGYQRAGAVAFRRRTDLRKVYERHLGIRLTRALFKGSA